MEQEFEIRNRVRTIVRRVFTERTLQISDASRISGAGTERIAKWIQRGQFEIGNAAPGHGSRRLFSYSDIAKMAAFVQMLNAGLTSDQTGQGCALLVAEAEKHFQQVLFDMDPGRPPYFRAANPNAPFLLVSAGLEPFALLTDGTEPLENLIGPMKGGAFSVIPAGPIVKRVCAAIEGPLWAAFEAETSNAPAGAAKA